MSFRDDLGAAQARSEALERRVAELEEENRRLRELDREPVAEPAVESRRGRGNTLPVLLTGAAFAAGAAGAVFINQPGIAAVLGVLALLVCLQTIVLSRLVYVAPPGVALVFAGRVHRSGGVERRYRVVIGGSSVKIPILEHVEALDLRDHPIELTIASAYCKENLPVTLELAGRVHIARSEPRIHEAVERFLGARPTEIARVAAELIEDRARALVSCLTSGELHHDREQLADEIIAEADRPLRDLGLEIEDLEVLEVRGA